MVSKYSGPTALTSTRKRSPSAGVRPTISKDARSSPVESGLSVELCVSRTVRDTARLLDAVRGPGVGDTVIAPPPARPYVDELGADPGQLRFVGVQNYVRLLQTPLFWQAVGNTLYFVGVGVPLSIAASFGAALLVHSRVAVWRGFFRTALFAPVVTTLVAVAVIWRYLFSTQYGLLNYALGRLGIPAVDWLGDPDWAMPAIIVFAVWKNFGYNMLIFLTGLQSIPEPLYEAARIDGASGWRQFRGCLRCPDGGHARFPEYVHPQRRFQCQRARHRQLHHGGHKHSGRHLRCRCHLHRCRRRCPRSRS